DQFQRFWLMFATNLPRERAEQMLAESGADVVVLRPDDQTARIWSALEASSQWVLGLLGPTRYGVFIRKGSAPLEKLGERLRANSEWRPDTAAALLGRGSIWVSATPPDVERAVECWRTAVAREPRTGLVAIRWIVAELRRAGRTTDAQRYLTAQAERFSV